MSVHNRLLLNRLAVSGYRSLEVMLALDASAVAHVTSLIEAYGGRVRRVEASIGYLRAELPIDRLTALVADPEIDAYQISSLSRGSWYRDGPPAANVDLFRRFEVQPIVRPASPTPLPALPALSASTARDRYYTADEPTGVAAWLSEHPAFDGRGITIAFLETAQAEFTHPIFHSAKTLDGREIPKLAGIVNVIDEDHPDDTRVDLDTTIEAVGSRHRVGSRTYLLPRPGSYRFGVFRLPVGDHLEQPFAVLRDDTTGEIWVDSNGNGDFRSETPIADVNTRVDVRVLHVGHPRRFDLPFVVAAGRTRDRIHVYTARGGHQTMTVSVAAGSRTDDGLAFGVAPNARVLLVRTTALDVRLANLLEGYLDAIKRPDVDILCDSAGLTLVPDTARDFAGLFVSRLIAVYRKPIVHAAGNSFLFLNGVSSLGDAFSVGGALDPSTFAAFYGGGVLGSRIAHPLSVSGPALDGALKPDFLAPVFRLAADVLVNDGRLTLPRNEPSTLLPPGYMISCCTSASSPYAAGVIALLLSAAKQEGRVYSVDTLGRALRASAQFLPDVPAHQQGSGVLDVRAAWDALHDGVELPRIQIVAPISHALADYSASGRFGSGLFEREG